jgi:peptidoglycan/xylan/chitin deacetylase (PgdA/CDA1 family)
VACALTGNISGAATELLGNINLEETPYKALSDTKMHAYRDQLLPLPQGAVARDPLDVGETREIAASGLVRFGSHPPRQTRLRAGVSGDLIKDEVVGSSDEIEQLTGSRPKLFCYANGDVTPESLSAVREYYRGAAAKIASWNATDLDPLQVLLGRRA